MNKRYTLSLSIIALMAITICAPLITSSKACADYDQYEKSRTNWFYDWSNHYNTPCNTPCSIRFIGTERTQSGVKFIYEVTSGSKDVASVQFSGLAFKKVELIGSSQGSSINTNTGCIKFNLDLKSCSTVKIWFELENNYNGIGCGCISYTISEGCTSCSGIIKGPVLNTDFYIPHF